MNTRNSQDDNFYFVTFIKSIQFFLVLIMVGMIFLLLYFSQCEEPKKQVPSITECEYECPVVADTVKNDWVKDDGICIEKRIVYDQMLKDIDR